MLSRLKNAWHVLRGRPLIANVAFDQGELRWAPGQEGVRIVGNRVSLAEAT